MYNPHLSPAERRALFGDDWQAVDARFAASAQQASLDVCQCRSVEAGHDCGPPRLWPGGPPIHRSDRRHPYAARQKP